MSRESYDAVPYPAQPFAQSHPRTLEGIATLLSVEPPSIETARVLELGCATGGNLVPMAAALPRATFVGIDYSPVQIDRARQSADALSLTNIRLEPLSILDITPRLGQFDYIIAHGLLSWVTPDVRDKTFQVIRDHLAANGVAFVSYNALPGWHSRQWMREMMMFHAPHTVGQSAEERVKRAREICEIVAESPEIKQSPAGEMLRRDMSHWVERPAQYVVHDYLEESNYPFYFFDFVAQATAHGLQYLADAQNNSVLFESATPQTAPLLKSAGDDIVRREQYFDFLRNTTFRRSLLVRADRRIDRNTLADRFAGMHVTSRLASDASTSATATATAIASAQPVSFLDPGGVGVTINHRLTKAALATLQSNFPQSIQVAELLDRAARMVPVTGESHAVARARTTAQLLRMWGMNLVQIYQNPPRSCARAGDRPEVWPVARQQAASGALELTNLRHELVLFPRPFDKIVVLFDGTRSRDQLVDALIAGDLCAPDAQLANKPVVRKQAINRELETMLEGFARESLLVA